MRKLLTTYCDLVQKDDAIQSFVAFTGGSNSARMFITLKSLSARHGMSADEVIGRLRSRTAHVPGALIVFQAQQDLRVGGHSTFAEYQYSLQATNLSDLSTWSQKLATKMRTLPGIEDVNSDQQNKGLEATLTYDRADAARLGLTSQLIDDALYDAFGQRQVSTMYTSLNQYHVVMEVDPSLTTDPTDLRYIYVKPPTGPPVPLSEVVHYARGSTALAVNHQGLFPAVTLSFNLLPGTSLSQAIVEIQNAGRDIGMPQSIQGNFAGTAQAFQDSLSTQPYLIAAALIAVYIVLGMLYESLIHPITILSTLPSAGVGALLALLLFHTDLSLIALIGIILLIGIVKKNAIMMIDFALQAEREQGMNTRDAIYQACILRFRPILMTTMAALLGGLPLALGNGVGSELRKPLGIAIVGGLLFSQVLTLYTTPVIYLYLDRLQHWARSRPRRERPVRLATEGAM